MKKIIVISISLIIILSGLAYKLVLDSTNKKIELLAEKAIDNFYYPDINKQNEIYTKEYIDNIKETESYKEVYNEEFINKIKEREIIDKKDTRYEIIYIRINHANIFMDKYYVSVRIGDILDDSQEYFKNLYIKKINSKFLIYNVGTDI